MARHFRYVSSGLSRIRSIVPLTNGVRAALLVATLCYLAACDSPTPPSATDVQAMTKAGQELVDGSQPMRSLFRQSGSTEPKKFGLEVFVDISASMRGYVEYEHNWTAAAAAGHHPVALKAAPAEKPPASSFVRLLREFANEEELLGYFGFGIEAGGAQPITSYGKIAPLDPKYYVKLNNDYAALLQQCTARPRSTDGNPIERVIITDGVQSAHDSGAGSALSQTMKRLQAWVDQGGVVEVRLLSAPYAGTYYSEELISRHLPYSYGGRVANRPFLAISLLTAESDLPMWDRFWKRNALSGLSTLGVLRCPREPVVDRPVALEPEEVIAKDVPVNVMFRNVWDLSQIVTLDGYHNIWRAAVRRTRTASEAAPATYPACFLLKGIKSPGKEAAEAELREMRPTLEVWQRSLVARTGAGQKTSPRPGLPAAEDNNWHKQSAVDLREFRNGQVIVTRPPGSPDTFRFTAVLGVPARNTAQAVVLTATPPVTVPPVPDWTTWSALDDSSATNLDKTLNLEPFVEQLNDIPLRPPESVGLLVLTYR